MTHTIERLGYKGDGIAAGPVFVDRVLPGEVVEGTLVGDRILDPKIISPSDSRIRPNCSAYNRCGGCALHHASEDFVAQWKTDIAAQALQARGIAVKVGPIITSPANSRRRAKLTGRRLKKSAAVGFLERKSDAIVPVSACMVLDPKIIDLIPHLEAMTQKFGSRRGVLGFWVLVTDTGIDLAVDGISPETPQELSDLAAMANDAKLIRLTVGDDVLFQSQSPVLRFGDLPVTPPPRAFVQATKDGEQAIQQLVVRALAGASGPIVDLFSGCGTIGGALAKNFPVHCVEGEADLIAALQSGSDRAQGLRTITTEVRDLFRRPIDAEGLSKFHAAVLDPPRAGAEAQVAMIAKSELKTVVMVSCNPVTFARDAETLIASGFSIHDVSVIDQFRWSPHVELVAP